MHIEKKALGGSQVWRWLQVERANGRLRCKCKVAEDGGVVRVKKDEVGNRLVNVMIWHEMNVDHSFAGRAS